MGASLSVYLFSDYHHCVSVLVSVYIDRQRAEITLSYHHIGMVSGVMVCVGIVILIAPERDQSIVRQAVKSKKR